MTQIKRIDGWKVRFLRHLQQGQPVVTAARMSNVGLEKLYKARSMDVDFAREWDDKKQEAKERISKTVTW